MLLKVKDLIKKLENADPEEEVCAAPLVFIPVLQLPDKDGIAAGGEFKRTAAPFERYPIVEVGLMTDLRDGIDNRKKYVFLGYDEMNEQIAGNANALTTPELVN